MAVEEQKSAEQEVVELREQVRLLQRKLEQREAELQVLLRRFYGPRRERFVDHPDLPFDEPEEPTPPHVEEAPDDEGDDDDAGQPPRRRKRRRRGAPRLSPDIPRIEELIEPSASELQCPCCQEPRIVIGYEETQKLEYTPANCYLRVIRRPKLACKAHEEAGIVTPDLPPQAIHKGLAGESMLAQVVTAKYRDHLPLYRQAGIYRRQGVDIPESTLVDWIRRSAELLQPIVAEIHRQCLASGYISTDDTGVTLIANAGSKRSQRAFLWAYLGEQRGNVVFDFTPGRSRDGPKRMLAEFEGYLQADAYAGYDVLYQDGRIVEVGCMAHARRRFFDALDTDRERAEMALASIRALYSVERESRKRRLSTDERHAARQAESLEIFHSLRAWLQGLEHHVLPKSPIGKAVRYFNSNADALGRFLSNGRLEIDNNRCERAMRQVAVGRKNWLFAGSEAGGHRAATLYSLTLGCWELAIDPFEYLVDVLRRVSSTPCSEIARLTPRGWAAERND